MIFFSRRVLCSAVFVLMPFFLFSQKPEEFRPLAQTVKAILEKYHYDPRKADDRLSEQAYYSFLKMLDPYRLYFRAEDIAALGVLKTQIDDEFGGRSWTFLAAVTALYKTRLTEAEKIFAGLLERPLDFSVKDELVFDEKDSLNFPVDEAALKNRWRKLLKYQALWLLSSAHYEKDTAGSAVQKNFLDGEQAIRTKLLNRYRRNIKSTLSHPMGYENFLASLYYNAFTSCYDPHTMFFSVADVQNFKSELSAESLSFGFGADEDEYGNLVIARLFPGGPAWRSNELHQGDILIRLRWPGKELTDLSGAGLDELEEIFRSSVSHQVELTVKKTNGTVKTVKLIREKLRDDENIVKSFILKGEKKIGYISLPGFYMEWENAQGLGCANDVAKAILKLKQENIEGLIVDVRYNGGGSLDEGMDLAGIFIDEGPMLLMRGRNRKPLLMKDMNRGTIYDGPLALMVNGQSASASEVLAAVLQDYNRAVIVGDTTYGKATGQIILPLDTTAQPGPAGFPDHSFRKGGIKVTTDKLYRITGKSVQWDGVHPDILLPEEGYDGEYRESSEPFALPPDTVNKKVNWFPHAPLPLIELSQRSRVRVQKNKMFTLLHQAGDSLSTFTKNYFQKIPLDVPSFRKMMEESYRVRKIFERLDSLKVSSFSVEIPGYDMDLMKMDTFGKEISESVMNSISGDAYVEETFLVLCDLITLLKK